MNLTAPGEKFASSQAKNVDALHSLATLALDGAERVFELSLDVVRSAVEDGATTMQSLLTAEATEKQIELQSRYSKVRLERTIAYVHNLSELSANAQLAFTELAQRWLGEQRKAFQTALEAGATSASVGPQAVMAATDSTASMSKDLYDRIRRAGVPLPSEDSEPAQSMDITPKTAAKPSTSRKGRIADEGEA